jgi:hypothetical protein
MLIDSWMWVMWVFRDQIPIPLPIRAVLLLEECPALEILKMTWKST